MTAEIEMGNPERILRPGMLTEVRIDIERKANALLIPAEVLLSEKGKNYVFMVREGKATKVPVKTGFDDGISVEVLEGVSPRDPLIAAGKQSVTDGQAVNAVEAK